MAARSGPVEEATFRHLLVPLDGSPMAESSLPPAARLAELFRARVTLLHVLEPRPPASVHGARHLADRAEAKAYLETAAEWLSGRGAEVDTHVHAPGMEAARGVAEHVRELDADLVILCAHGGRGLRGFLQGRVGQQVVGEASSPVLVVPAVEAGRDVEWRCRRVLLALDEEGGEAEVLGPGRSLAKAADAEIGLVRVVPTAGTVSGDRRWPARLLPKGARAVLEGEKRHAVEWLSRLGGELEEEGFEVRAVVERGDPVRGIRAAARRLDADVVVLATRGLAGLPAVWNASVAAGLIERTRRSVLLVRRGAAAP